MSLNSKGFTMIEMLVSVLILTVGLLGLFQAVYATIHLGMRNSLRTEAIAFGDEVMARELARPYDSITTSGTTTFSDPPTRRNVAAGQALYSSVRIHSDVSASSKNVQVKVSWSYKGVHYVHTLSSLMSANQ